MIQVSELSKETRSIDVPIDEETLHVRYRVHGYTSEVEMELLNAGRMPAAALARILSRLVAEWDLMDGERMYPTSEEALSKLSLAFLMQVLTAIAADMRPNPPNAGS